jgi:CRP/FNR family transcriptional regulator, cyclic AMP receptor protein
VNAKSTIPAESRLETPALSASDLFEGLPTACLQAIEQCGKVQDFRGGHVFFKTGENGKALFLLEKGAVQTFRTSAKKKLIIADLKPLDVFGEMGCVGQCIYHCCAQATEPSRIRTIWRSDLDALLERCPTLTRRLLDLVSRRFVHVLMDLDSSSFHQLIPRLASLLLLRAQGDLVRNITHKELAQHLRVYRESATAALGELKKAGIIEVKRKQIRILHRGRLERAARE